MLWQWLGDVCAMFNACQRYVWCMSGACLELAVEQSNWKTTAEAIAGGLRCAAPWLEDSRKGCSPRGRREVQGSARPPGHLGLLAELTQAMVSGGERGRGSVSLP